MSLVPASEILAELGPGSSRGNGLRGNDLQSDSQVLPLLADQRPGRSVGGAAKLDEAYRRGLDDGRNEMQGAMELKLRQVRDTHQENLLAERKAWAEDLGEKLAGMMLTGLEEIETELADAAARVLRPFVSAALQRQAVDEFAQMLRQFLLNGPAPGQSAPDESGPDESGPDESGPDESAVWLEVFGPEDLIEILTRKLDGKTGAIAFHIVESCDLRVTFGRTLIETRLAAWAAKLDEGNP